MRTNLSKHTCCFSDLAWPSETPTFPRAKQVGEYLESYAQKYLGSGVLNLGCQVISVTKSDSNDNWTVTWFTKGREESAVYDYLIIACGFFSEAYIPPIPGLETFPGGFIHSSAYTSPDAFKDKHVAIVGGSLSSVEVADDIAPYAASIHHVVPRPFWVIAKYLPVDGEDRGSKFLPLDLVLYRRRPQPQHPPSTQEQWIKTNQYLSSFGGDLSEFSVDMKVNTSLPPRAVVSDMYANYVRSGRVAIHSGHLVSIAGTSLHLTPEKSRSLPGNITDIIFATGFRPSSASTILSTSLLSSLNYSKDDLFIPIPLHRGTLHPSLPNAGFVGHYRGPYWGIIELQARWCAGLFSGSLPWPSAQEMAEGVAFEEEIRQMQPRPQWPRGDYVTFGNALAETVGISLPPQSPEASKRDLHSNDIFGPHLLTPPQWLKSSDTQGSVEMKLNLNSLEHTITYSAESAGFVAAAVFRSLHGPWMLSRTYISRRPEYPSGPSTGTADFIPRKASSIPDAQHKTGSRSGTSRPEYLYTEKTELTTSNGLKLSGTQQYIYQYDEANDKLEVYFAKRDATSTLDYFFHRLEFIPGSTEDEIKQSPWRARTSHFCSPDNYEVEYAFYFKGADLEEWKIEYEVRGPKKDYTMETWYRRK
jgi:cation diffusion facilitator CzcD-associated flavoprotein CzcO